MRAIGNKVIVEYVTPERKSDGGIILTGVAMSSPVDVLNVKVVSVGGDVPNGVVSVGDVVMVKKHHLNQLSVNGDIDNPVNTATVVFENIIAIVESE